ncbi:uncharacterized protein MAL13P1.304 isoform X2 [Cephus cinctus]|nr:uncharacterized protein MAL13P1.304 isoform X2 [Cephus cinctus]
MSSSSCDSEEEICWWKTKNLIKERLIDDSLIHMLKRARKLQKETKEINVSLRNYVKTKLRERRQSLNSSNKHEKTLVHDTWIVTDSESSGVDDVVMTNSKPSTSARSCNNHSATSKYSSNKVNVKSKAAILKNVRTRSKEAEKIKKQDTLPKIVNDTYNANRTTNTNRVLRSSRNRLPVSSLNSANRQNTNLSHELNNLSDRSSLTLPINKLNGVLNGENNKNNLTNSKEELKNTVNSVNLNISSEEMLDPIRRLPKGPATIKKNLFSAVKNESDDSQDISSSIKRLPANVSFECESFHQDKSIIKVSDLRHEKSNINILDKNNLPEELNSNVKLQDKNAENSKAECSNDIQNSVLVSENAAIQNSFEEMRSPTHSLSFSQCESISGDDSVRKRFVPKVKSNEILKTRYKIVKLRKESKNVSYVRPLMISSPNIKSLYCQDNTVDEISKVTDEQPEDGPKSNMKIQDNHNVCGGLDKSYLEEKNNSYTAISINHPKKNYDSSQENLECLNGKEKDLPIARRTLNFNTSSEFQETANSKKMLRKEVCHIEYEIGRTDQRNSLNLDKRNEALRTKVTSDLEINDDLNLSPTHPSNSNRILSNSVTEIESLRCIMKKLNTQKENYDVDVMKEYEDQFLKKREQQSISESINTVHNRRPVKIQDLVAQSNFTQESSVTSLTMNDISLDDEIFIFEIPKTVDVHNFRNKKFMFQGDNEIVIGGEKFEVYERENRSMSMVLNKGELERSYGAVNLKAVRSVYMRPKLLNAEIEACKIDKEEEIPKPSTVPFPKNLRSRHPLLGCDVVANKISVSEENDEIDVTSKRILKWLTSQKHHDNEDPVTNGRRTEEEMKPKKQITDQDYEDVTMRVEECDDDLEPPSKKSRLKSTNDKHKLENGKMQYNFTEDEVVKEETSNKSSPRKKENIGLSDAFNDSFTTNNDMLSRDIKLNKMMLKKKKHETVDKPKWDNEPDSKTLKRKSSISCTESDSDIQKKKFKTSLDFSRDNIILTQGKTKSVKSPKVELDNKIEIHGKQLQMDTEVMKDEASDRFGLEASKENSKRKMKKYKKRKEKSIKDFNVSTGTEECVSSPERVNQDVLSSTLKARKEQQRRSGNSPKEKLSFVKKIKRKIQLSKNASSKSGIEKLNVTIESSQEEDESCGSKSSKNKKNKHVCLKDVLQRSYPLKVIPTLSPEKRFHSLSQFESEFENNSSICKQKNTS